MFHQILRSIFKNYYLEIWIFPPKLIFLETFHFWFFALKMIQYLYEKSWSFWIFALKLSYFVSSINIWIFAPKLPYLLISFNIWIFVPKFNLQITNFTCFESKKLESLAGLVEQQPLLWNLNKKCQECKIASFSQLKRKQKEEEMEHFNFKPNKYSPTLRLRSLPFENIFE